MVRRRPTHGGARFFDSTTSSCRVLGPSLFWGVPLSFLEREPGNKCRHEFIGMPSVVARSRQQGEAQEVGRSSSSILARFPATVRTCAHDTYSTSWPVARMVWQRKNVIGGLFKMSCCESPWQIGQRGFVPRVRIVGPANPGTLDYVYSQPVQIVTPSGSVSSHF